VPCLGICVDRRLDLVGLQSHAAAEERAAAAQRALAELSAIAYRLATAEDDDADWNALRARARAGLHAVGERAERGEAIAAWSCDACGRIEAPQPCIGVCVRPETSMVPAATHEGVLERDAALRRKLKPLAALARQLAWTTPGAGQRDRTARALRERARRLR
jgi:hypothetical protein